MRQSDVIRSAQSITARDAGIDEEAVLQMAQLLCTVIAVASVVVFHQSAVAGICIVPGLGLLVRKK
jgi:hypothetical protein